jgi:hypothetical protein
MLRLRLGILLFVISWLPLAQLFLNIAHGHNLLLSEKSSQAFRLAVWTLQFIIGLAGVWLAGKIVIHQARRDGWRKAPAHLWRLFWRGDS